MTALTSTFRSRSEGVMTTEVGTITGELELETVLEAGRARHRVRYAGADEWYHLDGGSPLTVADEDGLRRAHESQVTDLGDPGGEVPDPGDPPHGSRRGRDADDPAAGSFGGARTG